MKKRIKLQEILGFRENKHFVLRGPGTHFRKRAKRRESLKSYAEVKAVQTYRIGSSSLKRASSEKLYFLWE